MAHNFIEASNKFVGELMLFGNVLIYVAFH